MAYPTLNPRYGVKESTIGKTVKAEFDGNYVQQRPKTTRTRKKFEIEYLLTQSEFNTFDTFFKDNLGYSFSFVHPSTLATYTVRFGTDSIDATYLYDDLIKISVVLEEL